MIWTECANNYHEQRNYLITIIAVKMRIIW